MSTKLNSIKDSQTGILIVDDSTQYTKVLRRILEAFGYQCIDSVESTKEALDQIKANPEKYRLLFVDYSFPSGESGGALLSDLARLNLLEQKIAFLITSEPTVENVKEATGAGALGVVAKPFNRDELWRQLEKAERLIVTNNTEGF